MLAKVVCSSTDHGERGNKDRYLFEFRLKRTSTMPRSQPQVARSPSDTDRRHSTGHELTTMAGDIPEDEGETIATCFTTPIMCSGHHKAKRTYPMQRPLKVSKGLPTPKTKTVKRHKSAPNITMPLQMATTPHHHSAETNTGRVNCGLAGEDDSGTVTVVGVSGAGAGAGTSTGHSGSVIDTAGFPPLIPFLPDHIGAVPGMTPFPHGLSHPQAHPPPERPGLEYRHEPGMGLGHGLNGEMSGQSFLLQAPPPGESLPPTVPQPPRITEVRPDHGPIRKTTDVLLRGLFFREGMVPYFGCIPAQDIVVETASLIVCKAPESPLVGPVWISIYDNMGNSFPDLAQFMYTDDSETELLILQLQLRLAHRALEYLHTQATGQKNNAVDILRDIPGLATSPRSSSLLGTNTGTGSMNSMMDPDPEIVLDPEIPMLSLQEVEEAILSTLNNLPREIDLSLQLEDGSNLLHLSILMGFDRLAIRLIEDGCELEAEDQYGMTSLAYAVMKGNETVARLLVLAGASSSSARSPQEFYENLPREVSPTPAMIRFLSVSCTRCYPMIDVSSQVDDEEEMEEGGEHSQGVDQGMDVDLGMSLATEVSPKPAGTRSSVLTETADEATLSIITRASTTAPVVLDIHPPEPGMMTAVNPESGYHTGKYSEVQERLSQLQMTFLPSQGIQMSVRFVKLNAEVGEPRPAFVRPGSTPLELFRTGDSFGLEIRLSLVTTTPARTPQSSDIRSEQLVMRGGLSSGPRADKDSEEETMSAVDGGEEVQELPNDYLGIRFPTAMVKRVGGRPASILSEMTYILRVTTRLGPSALRPSGAETEGEEAKHRSNGGGAASEGEEEDEDDDSCLELDGACDACSKFLHENRKLSPVRQAPQSSEVAASTSTTMTAYPIIQFSIPGTSSSPSASSSQSSLPSSSSFQGLASGDDTSSSNGSDYSLRDTTANSVGVVEMREGICEVKARVNCSSMHHLIQREWARRMQRIRSGSAPVLAMADLTDPGFVFRFELVHPLSNKVVAESEMGPILFQSYSRGRGAERMSDRPLAR
ncbi:SPT3 Dosage dependent suppressor of Ty-induced promoter mutations-like protein [Lunasporangiospora selenospora]|uniref:SPT3 Dosage dependent suppressor of Ty-induced promoter mutations-like protein n=1 Tax=Lunasporangiospora selenospora TaxID=979761 RepID=A0A9P6FTL0_9FUNG|nr:SPT3 Dosage dependent suppressor of Ty-induced promoter mutations-like protein [Lunasporangiospora selenospora]